ncbi:hypothetical protein ACFY00_05995 [Kitasatospora sp. NPDC001540]
MSPHALFGRVARRRGFTVEATISGRGYTRCWRIRYRANLSGPEQTVS